MICARRGRAAWLHIVLIAILAQGTFQSNHATALPECYQAYPIGNLSQCPSSCSVRSVCAAASNVQCVRPNDCGTLHTGGAAVNGACVYCGLVGCATCASTTTCATCLDAFELQDDGTCVWKNYTAWAIIMGVVCLVCLWMFTEFVFAHFRPITNKEALTTALQNRSRMKVRDESKPDHPFFPLTTAMHTQPICGPGMPLFMNWFVFVMIVSLWQIFLSGIFWPDESTFDTMDNLCAVLKPELGGTNGSGVTFDVDETLAEAYYDDLLPWVSLSYFGTVLIFVVFLFLQRHLWNKMHAGSAVRPMLHRYVLEAQGFPSDATDTDKLIKYFQDVLEALGEDRDGVAEISIAYNFCEITDQVTSLIDEHLEQEEKKHRSGKANAEPKAAEPESQESKGTAPANPGPFWVQLICYVMLGTDFEMCGLKLKGWSSTIHQKEMRSDEKTDFLSKIENSGSTLVAFKSLKQKRAVRDIPALPVKFDEKHTITVNQIFEEPQGVLWQNYGISSGVKNRRILYGILLMTVVLVLWVALYYPWSKFTKESIGTASNLATIADLTISLTIPVGNALVAYAVCGLVDYYGFRHNGTRDRAYLYIIVPCLFVNVLSDIFVTMRNSLMSLNESLADQPNFIITFGVRAIINDMFALLFPGYSLIPYIGEPMCCFVLPFFVGMWRIKQDSRIDTLYAEQLMAATEIDIVNPPYGDIVATTATFMFTFLAPSRVHWSIFIAYFIFGAFLYAQNRLRILRWHQMTYFGTNDEHVAVSHLWGLPLGLLAASFGAQCAGQPLWGIIVGSLAFCGHNILHFLFVRYVITWTPVDYLDETYDQVLARRETHATYRNTNAIEVLKNQSLPREESKDGQARLVFYRPGKSHLQPNAGQTYEGDAARTDLKEIIKHEVGDLLDPVISPVKKAVKKIYNDNPDAEALPGDEEAKRPPETVMQSEEPKSSSETASRERESYDI